MHALNLYTLTRADADSAEYTGLLNALSGRRGRRQASSHEALSLCALVDRLASWFAASPSRESANWLSFLDGFWFSYSIAHISKEFDLLKFSADAEHVLNIELKSASVTEDRIRRQLEQNRYYLSNVSKMIYSFTYVMETDTLYQLNEKKYFRKAGIEELAAVLTRSCFTSCITEGLDRYFRASDYLISPVSSPERLLQGKYFLTNQQWEFRRKILELVRPAGPAANANSKAAAVTGSAADAASDSTVKTVSGSDDKAVSGLNLKTAPVITITGSAGTGKTLLLFDLAIALSEKKDVLFLHGGPLREGHLLINRRLRNVSILSGTDFSPEHSHEGQGTAPHASPDRYAYILIDEANRLSARLLFSLLSEVARNRTPVILSYDPFSIRGLFSPLADAEEVIEKQKTHTFAFSGNIRINRPVYSFMRNLFSLKDITPHADYSCIDVLCAGNSNEEQLIADYYASQGYHQIRLASDALPEDELVAQEYGRVLITLDRSFYYDDGMHLCRQGDNISALSILYEALTRTKERLAVLITENPELFGQILRIRIS